MGKLYVWSNFIYCNFLYILSVSILPKVVVFNRMAICTFRVTPYGRFVKLVHYDVSARMDIMP